MPTAGRVALALAAAGLLAGCGISDPYSQPTTTHRSARAATVTARNSSTPDPDGPTPAPAAAGALPPAAYAPTPVAALTRYAGLYLNWSWQTVRATEQKLASISQGQARAQALVGAQEPPNQLAQYKVTNAGQVAAVSPGEGPETGKWAVVADERTAGDGPYQGLPAVSEVIWATVADSGRGWSVTGWYPAGATP